jgi:excinuclease ABC subunit A
MQDFIIIKGAREHNLKNIYLKIPRQKMTVITGPSGSGKSSLAMDTIYAEGQRRYVESLSPYARQFLSELQKPDIDSIEGLSPSIAINQKTVTKSPRSTVGTITEIYDYMRVLYTRLGQAYCYKCGARIGGQETADIITSVREIPEETRIQILSPIVRDRKGEYKKELQEMRAEGFIRARIDGKMVDITEDLKLHRYKRHTIEIVVDRLIIRPGISRQLKTAIETALRYSDTVLVNLVDKGQDLVFSKKAVCPRCGISYPEITPMFFSFNSQTGACPVCRGLGYEYLEEEAEELNGERVCRACKGARLKPEALSIKVGGKNIAEFAAMPVSKALPFIKDLKLTKREHVIADRILKEVRERLDFLSRVGLGYLTLDRTSLTLSGGESQRIRLATQIGSSLTGVLYVLDEPTIGLHHRDSEKLLGSLSMLTGQGNTVIVVEHDEETMRKADHIVDMGPGAGTLGGEITAEGSPELIQNNPASITGKYLKGELRIPLPDKRRAPNGKNIEILGAQAYNLKNIDVKIPLGELICVTGVSGSGKSTLVNEILYKYLEKKLYGGRYVTPAKHRELRGTENIERVVAVEQKPLGRTPRSNPATYTGVFSYIRKLFSLNEESRVRGYGDSRFSFNVAGGRCEACKGEGLKKVEMHFLPDVYVLCDVCRGKRYNKETLEITYKGKNISDVLEMTISEALEFFSTVSPIRRRLQVLEDVGLGYLKLGQSATTLSGGEAQRVRLSKELGKKSTGRTLYILDEPTTGLHFVDIERLLKVLNGLVDRGNTVLVIEHNLDIIKSADYIIDLGPEGGDAGGRLVAWGTPEEVARVEESYTGAVLKEKLNGRI